MAFLVVGSPDNLFQIDSVINKRKPVFGTHYGRSIFVPRIATIQHDTNCRGIKYRFVIFFVILRGIQYWTLRLWPYSRKELNGIVVL